ncbi:MAG: ParB/Srx family N-terminal domain-containing protein, partial [Rhodoplanes sp.]
MLPVHMLFFLDAAILKEPEMGTQARLPRPPSEPGGEDERHDPMRLPWRPLMLPLNALRQADRKARTHSKQQIRRIADSILHLGFINPIVVDRRRKIVAGIGRFEAAKLLGLRAIPVICVEHLSEAQLRAYSLADNRLAERARWDRETLAVELEELQILL